MVERPVVITTADIIPLDADAVDKTQRWIEVGSKRVVRTQSKDSVLVRGGDPKTPCVLIRIHAFGVALLIPEFPFECLAAGQVRISITEVEPG